MEFNPSSPSVMHIDLNSCFASVEQQANPLFRGKPLVVAAYTTPRGCILAASVEAKRLGIKTGMRVGDGKHLCPKLIVLPPDPPKYRFINRKLLTLLQTYSSEVEVKSIDEMVVKMNDESRIMNHAQEIKHRIKTEIGEWLTVSIGISTNRYLAKIASNLHKPDGLDIIDLKNIEQVLSLLNLEDLTGIKEGYGGRLRQHGVDSPLAMYRASGAALATAFASKIGHDWQLMLHGWEPSASSGQDQVKTIGHSYALPTAYLPTDVHVHQVLCQLVEKTGRRLRKNGFFAQGIHLICVYADHTYWNHGEKIPQQLYTSRDLYSEALRILGKAPHRPVRVLGISCFALNHKEQLSLFQSSKKNVTCALDAIADRWGEFTVFPGRMLAMEHRVLDRIAFGGVR